ncbi:hypothetical protein [Micromonospora peucetia]|uniref:NACHT domain-containing protein n=1 Tax=Micromonospora peucetia TaxID=47871 RepID=A0ABZ1EC67_9ACTN|nr:hypothetical protein [Micromonospora peucetia]WSA32422.1 hypothetical protein OIE14_30725 [Micromonospora peucetia]
MDLDLSDKVASVVSGTLALATAVVAVRRHTRDRGRRGWWTSLRPLWRREADAGIVHPHRFGGYVKPLSEVYVPRRAVPRLAPAGDGVDVADLLTGAGNILLIGEPGSGKTALVRYESARSARRWLAGRGRRRRSPPGPVLVSLPAAALVRQPLPAALAEAYPGDGAPLDVEQPPAPGRRWLVCVDALDAVADPDERAVVLNRLAELARSPGPSGTPRPWRVLVTTRHLAEDELAVLSDGYPAYHLAHFTDADVALLAARWFPDGATARGFLDWTHAQHITDPVHNPLTATIAVLVWESGQAGAAPQPGPAALLDEFVRALLRGGRDSLDAACEALRRRPPDGGAVADWLSTRHTDLVEVAATAAVAGGDPVAAVVDWSAAHAPAPPAAVLPDWSARVRQVLLATDLFRADRHALASVWPSLVEYLAAGPLARDWRPDEWVTLMNTSSARFVALQAISRAAVAPAFLRARLAEPDGAIAAGHLLVGRSTAGAGTPSFRADVLAALLTHWSAGQDAPAGRDAARECFSLLTTLAADRADRDLLHEIATDPRRPGDVRRAAALFFAVRTRTAHRTRARR